MYIFISIRIFTCLYTYVCMNITSKLSRQDFYRRLLAPSDPDSDHLYHLGRGENDRFLLEQRRHCLFRAARIQRPCDFVLVHVQLHLYLPEVLYRLHADASDSASGDAKHHRRPHIPCRPLSRTRCDRGCANAYTLE